MLSIKQNFHRKTNGSLCNGRLARPKCGGLDHDFFTLVLHHSDHSGACGRQVQDAGFRRWRSSPCTATCVWTCFLRDIRACPGLARKEHQEADNQLRYAGVSIVRTSESVIHTTLTQSDTAGKHHTLSSGTSCCESIPGLVPEKDFPKEKSLIRYSGVQHFHSATSLAMLTLWGIGAAIAVSVDCSPEHMWILPKSTACNGVVSVVRVSMRTKGMLMVLAGKMDGRDDS